MALDDISKNIQDAWNAAVGGKTEPSEEEETTSEEQVTDDQTQDEEPEDWNVAREQGWMPEKEWEEAGKDPELWKPAKAFLADGEIRQDLRKVKRALKKREKQIDALIAERSAIAQNAYNKALKDLKEQRKQAAEEGDMGAVLDISEKIDEIKEQEPTDDKMKKSLDDDGEGKEGEYQLSQEDERALMAWGAKNQWYVQDARLRAFHEAAAEEYMQQNEGVSIAEAFEYAGQEVKKSFPARFRGKKSAGTVLGTDQAAGVRSSRRVEPRVLRPNELPDDLHGLYQNYRKLGMFKKNAEDKNGKWTYEEWARSAGLVES